MHKANRPRFAPAWPVALGAMLGLAATLTGLGPWLDRAIDPLRFAAVPHQASGQVVVVEMDASSVAAIRSWPWPRRHYARVVDQLRQAGAASIVFDVEFSGASNPADDAALAAAIQRAGGIVALPTFSQLAGSREQRTIDTLPLPALRANAALASVTMIPDPDGVVRYAPFGTVTRSTARPSLAAYLARRSGQAGAFFAVDYGIDPRSIPRLSFVDVRDGKFDPAAVRDRDVVIGATAVEMGDRYAVPRWGVLPGVIIQALGAETLLRAIPSDGNPLLALAGAILLALPIALTRSRLVPVIAGGAVVLFAGAILWAQAWLACTFPMAPGLLLLATTIAGRGALDVLGRFRAQRLVDGATGLPNRLALLASDTAWAGPSIAVASIINHDQLAAVLSGAGERDLVLRTVERLRMIAEDGMVWRLSDRLLAFALAEDGQRLSALQAVMLRPIEAHGRQVDVTLAIGLAEAAAPLDQALSRAVLAADAAAREGVFWARADQDLTAINREVSLMGMLDAAIAAGEIEVHYQPKLALDSDRIVSAEALVRWRQPQLGLVGPDDFIPLAEQTGRIGPLTLHVLKTAMRDVAALRAAGEEITVAVNISAKLVSSDAFNADVRALLSSAPVPPSALIFEVTESAAIADPAAAAAALQGYRTLGIAISMDDYGTGQSTLKYLQQLPLSEVKIDRSFVQAAHLNRNDAVLVRSTIEMAHELGLKVVAEGVEDAAALAFLKSVRCDLVQGYLISRPVPAPELAELIRARPKAAAA